MHGSPKLCAGSMLRKRQALKGKNLAGLPVALTREKYGRRGAEDAEWGEKIELEMMMR